MCFGHWISGRLAIKEPGDGYLDVPFGALQYRYGNNRIGVSDGGVDLESLLLRLVKLRDIGGDVRHCKCYLRAVMDIVVYEGGRLR